MTQFLPDINPPSLLPSPPLLFSRPSPICPALCDSPHAPFNGDCSPLQHVQEEDSSLIRGELTAVVLPGCCGNGADTGAGVGACAACGAGAGGDAGVGAGISID